jgi:catechol 2,3-dioxygenase
MTTTSTAATLRLGPVHLTVTDLDRSVRFYETSIGLRGVREGSDPTARDGGSESTPGAGESHRSAVLGVGGEDLLVLVEESDARPAGRHAGLYHFALLHPSRIELARAAKRLIATGTPVSGASDHGISEAIYLPDPDGNGIELAADRPRERWGDLSDPTAIGGPAPLDMRGLLAPVADEEPRAEASPELKVGHLHLHVGDIEQALEFWRDGVGFEVMTRFPSAAFIAAGGYHHHLGLNTWRGEGVPPQPDGVVGLRRWTIVLDDRADVQAVRERVAATGAEVDERPAGFLARDPWRNAVEIVAAGDSQAVEI